LVVSGSNAKVVGSRNEDSLGGASSLEKWSFWRTIAIVRNINTICTDNLIGPKKRRKREKGF